MWGLIALTLGASVLAVAATVVRLRRAAHMFRPERGDVILVFGAAVWPTGPSPTLRARGEHAARLYREGRAPAVLCGGTTAETDALRTLLRHSGVPERAILAEEATSTRDTVVAAIRHGAGNWRCVLAVSSGDHMHRVLAEARRQGLPAIGCPVPRTRSNGTASPPAARRLLHLFRRYAYEVAATWWYAISAHSARP
jgi:uncharacterized SAM-binding protein YcdF (DUF218 family)